jgi:glutathione synthase/RimK-type ligase-like ATP-grasp enzyme
MDDLWMFDFADLHHQEFVIKPNRGSKGRGIFVVKMSIHEELPISAHSPVSTFSKRL